MADNKVQGQNIGPWYRKTSREVYDNPWITLRHDEVLTPAGTDGIYGRVHFKNRAIGIVTLDKNNNTLLVGQYRYALNQYSWEIPMGGGPFNETPLVSAQRELKEEAGLIANQWLQLFKLHTSNSITDEEGVVFLAQDLQQGEQKLADTEGDLVVRKLPFNTVVAMVESGEITDLISIAAILAVEKKLRVGGCSPINFESMAQS